MKLSHAEAQALVSARLDGPLDPVAERELNAHLATCESCRAFNASATQLARAMQAIPYLPASPAVSRAVLDHVSAPRSGWARFAGALPENAVPVASAVAAGLIVVFIGAFALFRTLGNDDPETIPALTQTASSLALQPESTGEDAGQEPATELAVATEALAESTEDVVEDALPPEPTVSDTESAPTESLAEISIEPTAGDVTTTVAIRPEELTEQPDDQPTSEPETESAADEGADEGSEGLASTEADSVQVTEEPTLIEPSGDGIASQSREAPATPSPATEPTATSEPESTSTIEPTATLAPEPTSTTVPEPTATLTPEPTSTTVPEPTATLTPEPTSTTVPEPTATLTPEPTFTATPGPTATSEPDPTATSEPTPTDQPEPTSEPAATLEPTISPSPVPTATPEPDPTATPEPESIQPIIQPVDGSSVVESPDEEASEDNASPQDVSDSSGEDDAPPESDDTESSDVAQSEPSGTETDEIMTILPSGDSTADDDQSDESIPEQVIEPSGGGTQPESPPEDGDSGDQSQQASSDEPADEEPGVGSSSITVGSAEVLADIDDIPGPSDTRLGSDATGALVFNPNPGRVSFVSNGLTIQVGESAGGQAVYACDANGTCVDISSPSRSNGSYVDSPLGWINGGVVYERLNGDEFRVEYRLIQLDPRTGVAGRDVLLGGFDDDAQESIVRPYPYLGGLLVPTYISWLQITPDGVTVLDDNPVSTNLTGLRFIPSLDVISYTANGEIMIASLQSPGSPFASIPFAGFDYDVSPNLDGIAVATGEGIEIRDLDGNLVTTYPNPEGIEIGGLAWNDQGVVYVDRTSGVVRVIQP